MDLYFKNTLSGKKEKFTSLQKSKVKMYNCGPTVYSKAHIGNLRAYVFADLIRRVLLFNGYSLKQVINITDVGHMTDDSAGGADTGDDKMERAAKKLNLSAKEIARKNTKEFIDDVQELSMDTTNIEFPKATEYIQEQIAMVQTLEEKGYTYKTSDGIYFDTSRFKNYGKLGNINLDKLKEGARIEKNSERKHPTDFALWKFSKEGENRQQEWDSPWGVGFPGWHIECSAMIRSLLGTQIDIHTGGIDHIPIHHNNEIAQSEAISGKQFVKYWLHVAHILIDGKKISKSLGNTIYLYQIADKGLNTLAYRYWLLTGHYSKQINFTWNALEASNTALEKIYKFLSENYTELKNTKADKKYLNEFTAFINDDLNTAKAIAVMWKVLKDKKLAIESKIATLLKFDEVLGLDFKAVFMAGRKQIERKNAKIKIPDIPPEVRKLIDEREEARKNKNWSEADKIRTKITELGYIVKDTNAGIMIEKL